MPKYICSILIISNLLSQVDYSTQIQPIFDNNCISCHIDGGAYFGGLDLSSYSLVMEGGSGGNTIVPFDHSSSELFNRITLDESVMREVIGKTNIDFALAEGRDQVRQEAQDSLQKIYLSLSQMRQ